jgi:FKBP-type peptidyl-prolyl cis-trans isomerase (trigger factor)
MKADYKKRKQVMVETPNTNVHALRLELEVVNDSLCNAIVVVPQPFVATIYKQAAQSQQRTIVTHGFVKGEVPLTYIEQNFKSALLEHVQEFLFNYFVLSFLYHETRNRKLLVAGDPRIVNIDIEPDSDAHFTFALTLVQPLDLQEWKYFPFKAPKRKKYKDLDRQVDSFIKEEKENFENHGNASEVQVGDWVSFDVILIDEKECPLFTEHTQNLWVKIGDEEADSTLRELFVGKKIGDRFCSTNKGLQDYFSPHLDNAYAFCISLVDTVHNAYFCLESFKKYFKLKNNKDVYQKLIEVFSFRNDLSQRRSMVEEAFKVLLNKHRFSVPNHLILRQQDKVMRAIQSNPDYHVYRMQKDFKERTRQLAEKQAREEIIIDQIAYQEHIVANHQDIKTYLNLIKRPRTKEFIYFIPPISKARGQEIPISTEELRIACSREKTLNHIIFHLTQK